MRKRTGSSSRARGTRDSKESTAIGRTGTAIDPVGRLQRGIGNQALQRLAQARDETASEEQTSAGHLDERDGRIDGPPAGSVGRSLSGETRRMMERAFGEDFGDVRVHDGVEATAANRALRADAYATESDVVLRPDRTTLSGTPGRLLLAHELAHVAQYRTNGDDVTGTKQERPGNDAAEREARAAAHDVAGGGRANVTARPSSPVAASVRPWWQRQIEGTIENIRSIPSRVKSTASSVASGAQTAWSATGDAYHGIVDETANRMVEHGPFGMVYEGMKTNAALLDRGGNYLEGKVDDTQDSASSWMRGVLDDTGLWGEFGAEVFDQVTQVPAGLAQFGITTGKNLLKMGVNPVDTARGIEHMAAQVPMHGMNPVRLGRKARQGIWQGQDVSTIAREMFDPWIRRRERAHFGRQMVDAFAEPYRRSVGEDGDYMQGIARGAGEFLTFWKAGATKAAQASKASKAAKASKGVTGLPRSKGPSALPKSKGSSALPKSKGSSALPKSKEPSNLPRSKGSSALPRKKRASGSESRATKIERLRTRAKNRRRSTEPGGLVGEVKKRMEKVRKLRERAKQRRPSPKQSSDVKSLPGRSTQMKALPGKQRSPTPSSGSSSPKALPGRSKTPKALPGKSKTSSPAGRSSKPKAAPGNSKQSRRLPRSKGPSALPRSKGSSALPKSKGLTALPRKKQYTPVPDGATAARTATAARGSQAATSINPLGLIKRTGQTLLHRYLNSDLGEGSGRDGEQSEGSSWLEQIRSLF
ncbi:MAG: DUF4157 domain-containing protein [Haloarculaceae archaeon]